MIVKGEATYFDGLTSKATETFVSFDSSAQTFSILLEENTLSWNTSLCTIQITKGKLEVHLNSDTQYFESLDPKFAEIVTKTSPTIKSKNVFHRLMHAGFKVHLSILGFIIALSVVMIFFVLPYVAENSVVLIPKSFDDQIGEYAYNDMILTETIDERKSKLVQSFADKMELQNQKKMRFTVVESPIVNAFALPNGDVVIYTGILDQMKDYSELAALIGHEVSHVTYRHSMKALSRNLSTYVFISAILGDINGVITILWQNAAQLQTLSYSRKLEEEADNMGLSIIQKNQINPRGFVDLFETLNTNSSLDLPEFLSSHPVTSSRIKSMKKQAKGSKFVINKELQGLFLQIKSQN